jgi:hypothetical protein
MFARSLAVSCLVWLAGAVSVRAEEPLFPFLVSYDAPDNVTDVSAWLALPAGGQGFVCAENGRLATDAGPIRFWATNLCFDACFPSHEDAERVAARMARLGINCVRMHHMDNRSIWAGSPDKITINPERLEKLDYLIHQLKLHGIYTDINLHVSRTLGEREGFSGESQRPKYDKGLGNFEPRMIELQKKYARDLLTHVNPYTKTAYADEPAVAFVEISNEDALFTEWTRGSLDALPEPYAATYRRLWNDWLKKKYGGTESLRKAWNAGSRPLGDDMLEADFSKPLAKSWRLQKDDQSVAEWSVEESGPAGQPCLRVVVGREGGESWIPQFWYGGLAVEGETPYTLVFTMRADEPRSLDVSCSMDHEPWQRLGLSADVELGTEWKEHRFTFVPPQDDESARVAFSGLEPGTYELAAVSFRPGGIVGLEPDQGLEGDGVPVLHRRQLNLTQTARRDFIDFLWDTERDYWWGMYRFLKDDLQVRSLISGTQLGYGPAYVQAGLDYIDAHAYWNHPSFPNRSWDPRDWFVRNVALVNSPGGTLAGLAVRRVAGMAFTVSEYNHPFPNSYAAEGFPMIAAFGSLQKWDGVFSFTYSHSTDFEPQKLDGYFDIKGDPAKLVHMPACAALFLRGDAAPARRTLAVPMSPQSEREKLAETLSPRSLTADQFGLDPRWTLVHAVELDLKDRTAADLPEMPADAAQFVSDTGQLRWDVTQPGAGYFIADTPNTKLFTGFVRGRTFRLGEVTLAVGKTRLDWATVSMVAVDGGGFDAPGRVLVAATGLVQNTDAELEDLGGDRVTLRDRWGRAPILCEGIPAEIVLPVAPERVRIYPLDGTGNRRAAVEANDREGQALIKLEPSRQTLWYEIEIR